jgi:expansin (peptidoglycan-binding protein)
MNKKVSIVVIIVIVLGASLFLYRVKDHNSRPWQLFTNKHRRQPVSQANVSRISQWMTFDYVNQVFNLPPAYLKEKLEIDDGRYPLITINQYSKRKNKDVHTVIKNIQDAIRLTISAPGIK